MQTVRMKLSELHKTDKNIRRHSEKQIQEYVRSLQMFGQTRPFVVTEDGEILVGNGMYDAMLAMGAEEGDVYVIAGLRWVAETDPPFWEKIQKRMPNAYLVLLYWDSEMFARSSRKRRELEDDKPQQDYKEMVKDMLFKNTDKYRIAHDTLKTLPRWRRLYIKSDGMALPKHYKRMYEVILNGDPKGRDYRSLQASIFADYGERVKREEGR